MVEYNEFQERVDKLALFYLTNHYDVKEMSVKEFVNKFNETAEQIIDSVK